MVEGFAGGKNGGEEGERRVDLAQKSMSMAGSRKITSTYGGGT